MPDGHLVPQSRPPVVPLHSWDERPAGFVLYQLGSIPAPSDCFVWEGYSFEVVDMDGKRVDKLLEDARASEEMRRRYAF